MAHPKRRCNVLNFLLRWTPRFHYAWLALICMLVVGGCTPTHVVRIDMTGARPEVRDTLRAVGAGDMVRVVVIDSIWGNRYGASVNSASTNAVERNLVFGGAGLQKLTQAFAPVIRTSGLSRDAAGEGLAFSVDSMCVVRAKGDPTVFSAQVESLNLVVDRANTLRDSILTAVALLTSNEYQAIREFALDAEIRRLIEAMAADPLADEIADELRRLSARPSGARPKLEDLDLFVLRTRDYGRRLAGILALVPAAALSPEVRLGLSGLKEQVVRYRELIAEGRALQQGLRGERGCVEGSLPIAVLPLSQRGVDLSPFVNDPALDPSKLDLALRRIVRNTELLAASVSALPAWVPGPPEQLALKRSFEGNKDITVAVVRRPRYGRFEARVVEVPRAPSAAKKSDAAAAAEPAGGATSLNEVTNDTVAKVQFEVYPRYRFQLGAGFVRSPLLTRSYESVADTVDGVQGSRIRLTGETPFQVFPVALLSYNLWPLAGQIHDARVRPGWPSPERIGLAIHAGLSLNDPTEDVVFGLSTELFPGIRLGAGYHLAYVQVSRGEPGEFVPESEGAAVERRWDGEWGALSVAVDAQVFANVIGALLK